MRFQKCGLKLDDHLVDSLLRLGSSSKLSETESRRKLPVLRMGGPQSLTCFLACGLQILRSTWPRCSTDTAWVLQLACRTLTYHTDIHHKFSSGAMTYYYRSDSDLVLPELDSQYFGRIRIVFTFFA